MKKREPIPVDEALIFAAYRASTGASAHAIGETVCKYRFHCSRGVWRTAREYKHALTLLMKGETTNANEAWSKAADYFFALRKEQIRAHGSWPRDWEMFLGKSPKPFTGELPKAVEE